MLEILRRAKDGALVELRNMFNQQCHCYDQQRRDYIPIQKRSTTEVLKSSCMIIKNTWKLDLNSVVC